MACGRNDNVKNTVESDEGYSHRSNRQTAENEILDLQLDGGDNEDEDIEKQSEDDDMEHEDYNEDSDEGDVSDAEGAQGLCQVQSLMPLDDCERTAYVYKMITDDGLAPCAPKCPCFGWDAALTIAICKPKIREKARAGDRLIGIAGEMLAHKGYVANSVIYAAVVERKMEGKEYYTNEHLDRKDCIYSHSESPDRLTWITSKGVHTKPEERRKDLSPPQVLLCRNFCYFGAKPPPIRALSTKLSKRFDKLRQGHLVYRKGHEHLLKIDRVFDKLLNLNTSYTQSN